MSQIDRDVEIRLARTFQVKQALIRKAGLTVCKINLQKYNFNRFLRPNYAKNDGFFLNFPPIFQGRVVPANNGVYQHDLLLTEPQANALIAEINQHKAKIPKMGLKWSKNT